MKTVNQLRTELDSEARDRFDRAVASPDIKPRDYALAGVALRTSQTLSLEEAMRTEYLLESTKA